MPVKQRQRAVQQRAEETQEAIVEAAIELFSTQGFDGISIKAIEEASQTKRGLVSYHFGDKETLWKIVAERIFSRLPELSGSALTAVQSLGLEAQVRAHLTNFIYNSAKHPEVSRLIIQEGKSHSWRLDYIVENYVRPRLGMFKDLMSGELDAHTLYMLIGASTLVFDVEAECEKLFGFNPRDEAFIKEHAKRVCDLMLGAAQLNPGSAGRQAKVD
jgi:AcrR family transcriptional regulator